MNLPQPPPQSCCPDFAEVADTDLSPASAYHSSHHYCFDLSARKSVQRGQPWLRTAAVLTTQLFVFLALMSAAAIGHAAEVGVVDPDPLARLVMPMERGPLAEEFERDVHPRLNLPAAVARDYVAQLTTALDQAGVAIPAPKFLLLVDRNPAVQTLLVLWGAPTLGWRLIGATPVSTGLPGKFEHFLSPLGVFDHSRDNPDFRATGIKNKLGIRGYGKLGSRVYDFGWVKSIRGWGKGGAGELRFQMHSTDADVLERRLGTPQSEGCIRIPAALNEFVDLYGVLDEDYDRAVGDGGRLWLLRAMRTPTPWSGRYLVVIESADTVRPAWARPVALPH